MKIDPIEKSMLALVFEQDTKTEYFDDLEMMGFRAEMFTSYQGKLIWANARSMMEENSFTPQKIESFILGSEAFGESPTERVVMLSELFQAPCLAPYIKPNAMAMIEKWLKGQADIEMSSAKSKMSGKEEALKIMAELEVKLQRLREYGSLSAVNETELGCKEVAATIDDIEQGKAGDGMDSGVKPFNRALGGIRPGKLIVLAARPTAGKSALAEQIVAHQLASNVPVLYFQRELGTHLGIGRLAAKIADVEWWKVERHDRRFFSPDEFTRMKAAIALIKSKQLYVKTLGRIEAPDFRSQSSFYAKRHGVKLIVYDHLQLADIPRGMDRRNAIADLTKTMKQVANQFSVCVLALCQLKRETEKGGIEPTRADLKESGDIEQDADSILAMWYENKERDQAEADPSRKDIRWFINWKILKNRGGGHGSTRVLFDGKLMKFLGEENED